MAEKKETEEKKTLKFKEKLSAIQTRIKAPKDLYNKFGEYYYRNAESILEAVKPYLTEYNLSLVINDEIVVIGERYYVKATVTLADSDSDGFCEISAYARETLERPKMDASQITGSASSYARKYALNGLFLLDDTKDADTDEFRKQTEQPKKTSEKDVKAELKQLWEQAGGPADGFEEYYNSKLENGKLTDKAIGTMRASLKAGIDKKRMEEKKNEQSNS